jgi:hypothetical protein
MDDDDTVMMMMMISGFVRWKRSSSRPWNSTMLGGRIASSAWTVSNADVQTMRQCYQQEQQQRLLSAGQKFLVSQADAAKTARCHEIRYQALERRLQVLEEMFVNSQIRRPVCWYEQKLSLKRSTDTTPRYTRHHHRPVAVGCLLRDCGWIIIVAKKREKEPSYRWPRYRLIARSLLDWLNVAKPQ